MATEASWLRAHGGEEEEKSLYFISLLCFERSKGRTNNNKNAWKYTSENFQDVEEPEVCLSS